MPRPPHPSGTAAGIVLLLALLFFLAYLPAIGQLHRYRGDERFYTDAVLGMEASGDYLTPHYADGRLRFQKPIVPYWTVLAGFRLFGTHILGARIFFLAAGALTVGLSALLARRLFPEAGVGALAAAVLASNTTFFHLGARSTPDILLTLWMTVAFLGFAGLLLAPRVRRADPWLAWLGTGLAVATKGLLGLLPVVWVLLLSLGRRELRRPARDLLPPLPTLAGLAVAAAWYLAVALRHGPEALGGFVSDQVGARLEPSLAPFFSNLLYYPLDLLAQFLPWTLLLGLVAFAARPALGPWIRTQRPALILAGTALLLFLVVFLPGNIQRTRYFAPVFPFLAAVLAAALLQLAAGPDEHRWARRLLGLVYLAGAAAGLLTLLFFLGLAREAVLGGAALATLGGIAWILHRRLAWRDDLLLLAVFLILSQSALDTGLGPVRNRTPAPQLARWLEAHARPGERVAGWDVDRGYLGQVRLLTGGRWEVDRHKAEADPDEVLAADLLLLSHGTAERVRTLGWEPEPVAVGREGLTPRDLWRLRRAPDPAAALRATGETFYAVRLR